MSLANYESINYQRYTGKPYECLESTGKLFESLGGNCTWNFPVYPKLVYLERIRGIHCLIIDKSLMKSYFKTSVFMP